MPFEDIHLKHLSDTPLKLQRLFMKFQPDNFVITYVPGIKIPIADTHSQSKATRVG